MSAYTALKEALDALIPATWKLVPYEPVGDDLPDVTSVTMKIREVRRLRAAPLGKYEVDWVITITTPYTSRATSDPTLFDELVDFLGALEAEGIAWTSATKVATDEFEQRLAYDITVQTEMTPERPPVDDDTPENTPDNEDEEG